MKKAILLLAGLLPLDPVDVDIGYWPRDASGYYYGSDDLSLTPRAMAKFGGGIHRVHRLGQSQLGDILPISRCGEPARDRQ